MYIVHMICLDCGKSISAKVKLNEDTICTECGSKKVDFTDEYKNSVDKFIAALSHK